MTSRPWTVHIDSARDAIAENHLIVSDLDVRDEEEAGVVVDGRCREM